MNEKEKKAIEYLKTRLYGNEGCKHIDVSQEDLRIFINLVDRKEKDIEGWKKYCEEIEEEQTEMSNKNCELEFEIDKLQKENEELKIKNNAIKRESEAYAENMIRLDNELNLEKEKSKYEWIRQNCLSQELVKRINPMTEKEAQKVLDEMQGVRPEMLEGEAKKLFEAIMVIADGRDRAYKELEQKDKQINLMADYLTTPIHGKEWVKKYFEDKVKEEK
jgi:chromosome segregation ATPase